MYNFLLDTVFRIWYNIDSKGTVAAVSAPYERGCYKIMEYIALILVFTFLIVFTIKK